MINRWLHCLWILQVLVTTSLSVDPTENEIHNRNDDTHHPNPKSPASKLPIEVDILNMVNVTAKDQGVSLVEGPISKFPAFKFRSAYNSVPLPNSAAITRAINNTNGFTLIFIMRQQKNNFGTLLSVNSPGRLTPWLELSANSRTGVLSMKYKVSDAKKPRNIDWTLPKHHRKSLMAAWTWIGITVDYRNGIVRLDLDCSPSKFDSLSFPGTDQDRIVIPEEAIVYFGQEPGRKKKYLGSVQVAKILPYVTEQRLWSCMQISHNLAPEFRKPIS